MGSRRLLWCLLLCLALLLSACGETSGSVEPAMAGNGHRDASPRVLTPSAPGLDLRGNDRAELDCSNLAQGYVTVRYLGDNDKVRLQLTHTDGTTYTYVLATDGEPAVFPLTCGDGDYTLNVFENIEGDRYAQACGETLSVALDDPLLPFLYPNQYVNFDENSRAVALGQELAEGAGDDLAVVQNIYEYIIDNIRYDSDRAASVTAEYIPDVDQVIDEGRGICFDYAALCAALLRSQGIATRLVVGYAGQVYHAWISVYLDEVGWVNNIIEFSGEDWVRMDPTFDANGSTLDRYIGSGSDYNDMYYY